MVKPKSPRPRVRQTLAEWSQTIETASAPPKPFGRKGILRRTKMWRDQTAEKLDQHTDFAIGNLQRLKESLAKDKKPENELGALQATGIHIDRLCGELSRLNDMIALLEGRDPH